MEISIAFQTDKPLSAYGTLARQAEEKGFDGVSVYNDLLYQPAWLPLLEVARATQRVRIGPAAVNPFTCHPINIAGQIALIDEASQGRTYLGLARGSWLDYLGIRPRQPISALREAFAAVRHLLRQAKEPLDGDHFPLAGGDSLRWEIRNPDLPFMVGTWGPLTVEATLPHIDEVKVGGTANPSVARWMKATVAEPDRSREVGVVLGAVTVVDQDRGRARALARREVALYLPVVAGLDPTIDLDPELLERISEAAGRFDFESAGSLISDEILDLFAFAGTPEEIARQTLAIFDAGASRVEFGTPHGLTSATGLELLGGPTLAHIRSG